MNLPNCKTSYDTPNEERGGITSTGLHRAAPKCKEAADLVFGNELSPVLL